ncbi:hypothetical protein [Variovorax sp. 770b2]|uniref:hypothetical protein n=1 Tax=Variovorax sp. 770b2 TaxID=1566271 RepID=UPI001160BDB9|nr:hypothetical protein [Variovorax sp. 770b2]
MKRATELLERSSTSRVLAPLMDRASEDSNYRRALALYKSELREEAARLVNELIRNVIFERSSAPNATQATRLSRYFVFAAALAPGGRIEASSGRRTQDGTHYAQKAIAEDPTNLLAWKKGAVVEFAWLRDDLKILEAYKQLTTMTRIRTIRVNTTDSREDFIEAASWVTDVSNRQSDVAVHEEWLLDEVEASNVLSEAMGQQFYVVLARRLAMRLVPKPNGPSTERLRVPISQRLQQAFPPSRRVGLSEETREILDDALLLAYAGESNNYAFTKSVTGNSAATRAKSIVEGAPLSSDFWASNDAPYVARALYLTLWTTSREQLTETNRPIVEAVERAWSALRNSPRAPRAYRNDGPLARCPANCDILLSIDSFKDFGSVRGISYISHDLPVIEEIRKRTEKKWLNEVVQPSS